MNYFTWKNNYLTGNKEIDEQHKMLFQLVNLFYSELFSEEFSNENIRIYQILEELDAFYEYHFKYERHVYSDEITSEHFGTENLLKKEIESLDINKKATEIMRFYRFAEFLRKWLIKHVLKLNDNSVMEILKQHTINISGN